MENYIQKIASRTGGENEMDSGSILTPSESGLSFMDAVDVKSSREEDGSVGDDLPCYPGSAAKMQHLYTNPDSRSQIHFSNEVSTKVNSQNSGRDNEPISDAPMMTPIILERPDEQQKILIESRQQPTDEITTSPVQPSRDAIISNIYETVLVPAEKKNILTTPARTDLQSNIERKHEDEYRNGMTILQPETNNPSREIKAPPFQKLNPPKLVIGKLIVEVVQQKKEVEKRKTPVSKSEKGSTGKIAVPVSLGKSGFGLGQF